MKAEHLAVVQGWDDTRATLRRWNANPWRVLRTWALGSLAVTAAAADPDLDRRRDHDRGPAAALLPRRDARRDAARLRLPALPQRARARAARAGLRGRVHRRLAAADRGRRTTRASCASCTRRAGPAAIAFVAAATLFSLGTQAYALGNNAAAHGAPARASRRSSCSSRCCRTRCPSCSRSSSRSPPGRSPAARGAFNELLAATFATTAIAIPLLLLAAGDRDLGHAKPPAARSLGSYIF